MRHIHYVSVTPFLTVQSRCCSDYCCACHAIYAVTPAFGWLQDTRLDSCEFECLRLACPRAGTQSAQHQRLNATENTRGGEKRSGSPLERVA